VTTNRPYLRIEHRRDEVIEFLIVHAYPVVWTREMFAEALIVRIFDDRDETWGYVWGTWADTGVMAIHSCIARKFRGRALSRQVFQQLDQMAFWLGADELVVGVDDLSNAHRVRLLLLRHGFKEEPGRYDKESVFIKNLWEIIQSDGKSFQAKGGDGSGSPASAPAETSETPGSAACSEAARDPRNGHGHASGRYSE
jgi:hypothetical protein